VRIRFQTLERLFTKLVVREWKFVLFVCFHVLFLQVGSLCDNVAVASMKTRQAIMRQWTKPVLKLNLVKVSFKSNEKEPVVDELLCKDPNVPTVEIVDSEMIVNFRLENANAIGCDLEETFK
jgi:hypothetical protein